MKSEFHLSALYSANTTRQTLPTVSVWTSELFLFIHNGHEKIKGQILICDDNTASDENTERMNRAKVDEK